MTEEEHIDISCILNFLPTPKKESKAESGCFYGNESPEEIYNRITYTSGPTQISYQEPPAPVVREEIEAVTELNNSREPQLKNTNNRRWQPALTCPYDFRLLSEVPVVIKPLATFDSQLQNVTIRNTTGINEDGEEETYPKIETITIIGKSPVFNSKMIGIRSSIKRQLTTFQPSNSKSLFSEPSQIDEDPFILEYKAKTKPRQPLRVFSTARALAAISVCQRSIYPFDLIIQKVDDENIFVKVRNENKAAIQETSLETIMTSDAVTRDKVTQEFIQNISETMNATEEFIQEVTKGMEVVNLCEIDKQESELDNTQPALIYRSIQLKGIEFIVRGQIDSIKEVPVKINQKTKTKTKNNSQLNPNLLHPTIYLCRTFVNIPTSLQPSNVWDNIEQRRGSIFLNETNVNSAKVARWVATAIFTGAETCAIGYIIRKNFSMKEPHLLLGVERHNTDKFAHDISLKESNMYGILSKVFGTFESFNIGTYIFMKDHGSKKNFSIYETTNQNNTNI